MSYEVIVECAVEVSMLNAFPGHMAGLSAERAMHICSIVQSTLAATSRAFSFAMGCITSGVGVLNEVFSSIRFLWFVRRITGKISFHKTEKCKYFPCSVFIYLVSIPERITLKPLQCQVYHRCQPENRRIDTLLDARLRGLTVLTAETGTHQLLKDHQRQYLLMLQASRRDAHFV